MKEIINQYLEDLNLAFRCNLNSSFRNSLFKISHFMNTQEKNLNTEDAKVVNDIFNINVKILDEYDLLHQNLISSLELYIKKHYTDK